MNNALGLDKHRIKSSFAAAAASYDSMAAFQRQIGLALLEKFPVAQPDAGIVDLGCGTGFLSWEMFENHHARHLLAVDIALPMLQACRLKTVQMPLHYVCADAEKIPLRPECVRAVYSNLALQWCQDLQSVFADCRRILQNAGELVFSTFGPQTLHELKTAWAGVDDFPHVNDFYSSGQIAGFLQEAGFHSLCVENIIFQSSYTSVMALMHELKGIGAHNTNLHRNRKITSRRQLQQMMNCYEQQMAGSEIVASYDIIFVRAVR